MRRRHVIVLILIAAWSVARPAAGAALDPFVLFAGGALSAKALKVTAGDVGGGGTLAAKGLDAAASRLYAPTVRLKGAARCADLHANSAKGAGKTCALTGPLAANPVGDVATACAFPQPFGSCAPGAAVTIARGKEKVLAPGVYGTVRLAAGARLVLDGAYTFCRVAAHPKSRIVAAAGSEVRVTDTATLGSVAAPGANVAVAGSRVTLGPRTTVEAAVCAPRAHVKGTRVTLVGRLAARTMKLARVTARLASATTTSPSTTTTTTLPFVPPSGYLDFLTEDNTGQACGSVSPGTSPNRLLGNPSAQLSCSSMNSGGIGSIATAETALPPGSTLRLGVANCVNDVCDLVANPASSPGDYDCSMTDCLFGPPQPIQIIVSACLVTRFTAPVTGTVDLATGVTSVNAAIGTDLYIGKTCPICDTGGAVGTPGSPASGTCSGGQTSGAACTTTNVDHLSTACLPPATQYFGTIPSNLSLTTGTATLSAGSGRLCPGQAAAGCFGNPACTAIAMTGSAPGSLKDETVHPAKLVSAFCIPSVDPSLIDGAAGFPGPGSVAISGQARFFEAAPITTTTSTSTTTTTAAPTTTTTVTGTTSTTTTTLIPIVTHFSSGAAGTNTTSTIVLGPASGIPAGSSVIVFFATNPGATTTGVSDSVNGAYTLERVQTQGSSTNGVRVSVWTKHNILNPLPANQLITVSHDSTSKRLHNAFYVRNLATSAQLDGTAGANAYTAAPATGTPIGTPAFVREVFFAAFGIEVGPSPTFTPSAGWTYSSATAARLTGLSLFVQYKVKTNAAAFEDAVTAISGGSADWAAIQHTYKGR